MIPYTRIVGGLLHSDIKNIVRAPILLVSALVPVLFLAPIMRFAYPWLADILFDKYQISLTAYSGLILAFIILLTPYLLGMVVGFMLVEERDENILAAIAVTPLSKEGFLLYRSSVPVALAALAALAAVLLSGLPLPEPALLACAILLAAVEAPILAAFLGATADNRVAALAMSKFAGIALVSPLLCLSGSPWQYAAGWVPHFWIAKLLYAPPAHPAATAAMLIGALLLHGLYLAFFMWRFRVRLG